MRKTRLIVLLLLVTTISFTQPAKFVGLYYAGWAEYNPIPVSPSILDYNHGTHWVFFTIVPTAGGVWDGTGSGVPDATNSPRMQTFSAGVHAAGRKAIVGTGGFGSNYTSHTTSGAARRTSALALKAIIDNNNYDGVDIDWEPVTTSAANFNAWIDTLRVHLPSPTYEIMAACFNFDPIIIGKWQSFDYINLMTYDQSGPYPGWVSWHNSPAENIGAHVFPSTNGLLPNINTRVTEYINAGVPDSILGFGIEAAGYLWNNITGPEQAGFGTVSFNYNVNSYANLMDNYAGYGYSWDDNAKTAYINTGSAFVSFDPDTGVIYKGKTLRPNLNNAGVIVYEVAGSYRPNTVDPWRWLKIIDYAFSDSTFPGYDSIAPLPVVNKNSSLIYSDGLVVPWSNASAISAADFQNTEQVYNGTFAIKATFGAWQELSFLSGPTWGQETQMAADSLIFYCYPLVTSDLTMNFYTGATVTRTVFANSWQRVSVPCPGGSYFTRVSLWKNTASSGVVIYVDSVALKANTPSGDLPTVPVLVSPANGATNQPITGNVFLWNTADSSTSYNWQLASTSSFTSLVVNTTTPEITDTYTGQTAYSTTYYWRVRAQRSGLTSAWSSTRNFTTQGLYTNLPGQVTLLSPSTGATGVNVPIPLVWGRVDSTTTYTVRWGIDSAAVFNNQSVTTISGLADTTYSLFGTGYGRLIWWKVAAVNSVGTGIYSTVFSFTTTDPPATTPMTMGVQWDPRIGKYIVGYQPYHYELAIPLANLPTPEVGYRTVFAGGYMDENGNIVTYPTSINGSLQMTQSEIVAKLNESPWTLSTPVIMARGLNLSTNGAADSNMTFYKKSASDLVVNVNNFTVKGKITGDGSELVNMPWARNINGQIYPSNAQDTVFADVVITGSIGTGHIVVADSTNPLNFWNLYPLQVIRADNNNQWAGVFRKETASAMIGIDVSQIAQLIPGANLDFVMAGGYRMRMYPPKPIGSASAWNEIINSSLHFVGTLSDSVNRSLVSLETHILPGTIGLSNSAILIHAPIVANVNQSSYTLLNMNPHNFGFLNGGYVALDELRFIAVQDTVDSMAVGARYGLIFRDPVLLNGGTIDTNIVLYVDPQTSAGVNIPIYVAGSNSSFFGGGIDVNNATIANIGTATITGLTEEAFPTTGDFLIAYEATSGAMRKVDVGNLPTGGGGEANTISSQGGGLALTAATPKSGVDLRVVSLDSADFNVVADVATIDSNKWAELVDLYANTASNGEVLYQLDASTIDGIAGVTTTEVGHLAGVTSAIQTQLGTKAPLASPTFTGTVTIPTPFTLGAVSVTPTGTELNFVDGVTSAIQTQLNAKQATISFGTGVETWIGTPTSANFFSAITDESGAAGVVPRFSLTAAAQGDLAFYNGTSWVNLAPSTSGLFLQTQGAAANPIWAAPAGGGTVTHTGGALTLDLPLLGAGGDDIKTSTAANMRSVLSLVVGTDVQAWDADLDYLATFTPTANVKSILNAADYAAIKTLLALVIGTDVQAFDADLTTWSGVTPGTGVGTFLATPSSANLAAAVTGETGSGAAVFGTSPDFTTGATIGGVAIPTISSTSTLTNKRWTARVGSTTSSATPTINTDNVDIYKLTAQAVDITSMTTNLSGTPVDGDILEVQITGTAARAITWGTSFVSSTVTLPTTTVTTATLSVVLQYFVTSSYGANKWVCVNSF